MDISNAQNDQGQGPFDLPLFNDPSVRALSRVGVIDVGSNSVRLVIFDGAARSPAYFFNEKIMCALGEGLADTGRLSPTGRQRALDAMRRFKLISDGLETVSLTAVATAAVREAEDGPEFVAEVERETGIKIFVIDGSEEARLSAQGVLLGWPGSYGLVCDIGGSSMELAEISAGEVGKRETSALGPLKLRDVPGGRKERKAYITDAVNTLAKAMGPQRNRLFLVGGSWRAIARIDMERRDYPLHVLHEYRMSQKSVNATLAYIEESDLEQLRKRCGVSSQRMSLVPLAAEVLKQVIRTFQPHDIAVSSYGIREGMLYEQMPQKLRERDPLIEACHFSEAKDARLPGFGPELYKFLKPLFKDASWERRRLVKAACLLHDVSWRAHPDYRAETCFDYVTRANLGGLRHSERVFLGLSLLHRYRNSRTGTRFDPLFDLLDENSVKEAEILGKAMRLGAMLAPRNGKLSQELVWSAETKHLKLAMSKKTEPLFGEVARARFKSLTNALDATSELIVTSK
ncbi:MAG: Ppx/GppA family phosphatase [Thalassovita sp.]